MVRGTARRLTRHWARSALVASAIALTAATLSRCSPVLQEAQGANAWSPVGGAVALASAPATSPLSEGPDPSESPPPLAPAPRVGAPSVLVANLDTGEVLFARRPNDRRPIASLTKIMTAMLVMGRSSTDGSRAWESLRFASHSERPRPIQLLSDG